MVLDIQTPLDAVDVNVSPDKREIFVHSENNLIEALKVGLLFAISVSILISVIAQTGLEQLYEPSRSTYLEQSLPTPLRAPSTTIKRKERPLFLDEDDDGEKEVEPVPSIVQAFNVLRPTASLPNPTNTAPPTQRVLPSRSRGRSPVSITASLWQMAPRPTGIFSVRSSAPKSPDSTQDRNLSTTHFVSTPKKTLEYEEEDDDEENGFSQDEEVRLILDNDKQEPPPAARPTRRLLQTTLNDVIQRKAGAGSTSAVEILDEPDAPPGATSSRSRLRNKIAGFASQGAVVDLDELGSDTDEEAPAVVSSARVDQGQEPELPGGSADMDELDEETGQQSEDEVEVQAIIDESSAAKTTVKVSDANKGFDSDIVMGTQEDVIELEETISAHVINNNQYIHQGPDEDITYIADSETAVAEDAALSEFRSEILKASPQGEIIVRCDIKKIRARAKRRVELENTTARNKKRRLDETDMLPEAGITNTDAAQVDRVLSRVIRKEDFAKMDILGQYNLAFIMARRKKPEENGQGIDDIFIIGESKTAPGRHALADVSRPCDRSTRIGRKVQFRNTASDHPHTLARAVTVRATLYTSYGGLS